MEDVSYRRVSRDAGLLGVPEDGDRAVVLIQRGLTKLVRQPLFKPVAKVASKLISKASPFDVEASSLVEALLPKRYLPPIVPLDAAYARAEAQWVKQREPFVASERSVSIMGEGWVEIEGEPQPSILDFSRGTDDRR